MKGVSLKIINVIEMSNGDILSIESYVIDKTLAELSNSFFTEDHAIKEAKDRFRRLIKENDISVDSKGVDYYFDEGYINNGEYEIRVFWSGINVNE